MANENKMEFVILGLLSHESLTGYEMKKRMDTTMSLFWSGSYGSIYPTLQRLCECGRIISDETTHHGRDKIIYSITESGRERLKQWLRKPVIKDELKYETLLKLFFGSEIGEEDTLKHIHDFEDRMSQILPKLNASVDILKENNAEAAHEYYMLTALFGVKIYEASIEWCEYVKKYFENKEKLSQ
ncbi:MAG: PadR family transcriptional regulator [Lachnospiraceae bacterium]|nr:PadR family transcriptional regulator [Lachnospiraceae bacterium]